MGPTFVVCEERRPQGRHPTRLAKARCLSHLLWPGGLVVDEAGETHRRSSPGGRCGGCQEAAVGGQSVLGGACGWLGPLGDLLWCSIAVRASANISGARKADLAPIHCVYALPLEAGFSQRSEPSADPVLGLGSSVRHRRLTLKGGSVPIQT